MWKRIRVYICLVTIISLWLASVPSALAAETGEEKQTVRVGIFEMQPMFWSGGEGGYTGICYDYLMEIAKYTKWDYEFVPVDVNNIHNLLAENTVDLMFGTYYREQYSDCLLYPAYSCGSMFDVLAVKQDNFEINASLPETLNGKTVGVYATAVQKIERLKKYLALKNISCGLIAYKSQEEYESCLENGGTDMMLVSEFSMPEGTRAVARYEAEPHYIVPSIRRPDLLDPLNEALEQIYSSIPDFEEQIYRKYTETKELPAPVLSEKEREYVLRHPVLRVAGLVHDFPFVEQEGSGDRKENLGIMWDFLDLAAQISGFQFEYIPTQNQEEAIELVREGGADVLLHVSDLRPLKELGLIDTQPYVALSYGIYKKNEIPWNPQEMSTAVIKGQSNANGHSYREELVYDTLQEAIRAVEKGEVDCVGGPVQALSYYTSHARADCHIFNLENENSDFCMAVAADSEPELLSILNKCITGVRGEQMDSLLVLNTGMMSPGIHSLQDFIYYYPAAVAWAAAAAVVLAGLAAWFFIRSRMKRQLLEQQIAGAERQSREKSEFLSRMSHEIRTPLNGIIGLTDLSKQAMKQENYSEIRGYLEKIEDTSAYLAAIVSDVLDVTKMERNQLTLSPDKISLSGFANKIEGIIVPYCEKKGLVYTRELHVLHDSVIVDEVRMRQVMLNLLANALKCSAESGRIGMICREAAEGDRGTAEFYFAVYHEGKGIPGDNRNKIFEMYGQGDGSSGRVEQGMGLELPVSRSIVNLMGGALEVDSVPGERTTFFFTLKLPCVKDGGGREELPEQADGSMAEALKGVRVLLVEDNEINADIASTLLEIQGAEVDRAENGALAVEQFALSSPGFYQVILMDIRMPVMDGCEAVRQIRALKREDAGKVPVIAMTADAFEEDRLRAVEAGMDDFLAKPVSGETLIRTVLDKTGEKRRARSL